jgi:hypothetical protein
MSQYSSDTIKLDNQSEHTDSSADAFNRDAEPTTMSPTIEPKPENVPFWTKDPNIIFNQKYIFEFFPTESMTYEQKLNAVTRTVILLTVIGFAWTKNLRLLFISAITLFAIFALDFYHNKEKINNQMKRENFDNPAMSTLTENGIVIPADVFAPPTPENPFENVMMTDYDFNPNKKPAGPTYKKETSDAILQQAKQQVIRLNPGQPDIADKLFKSLGDQYVFEQSMMPFYSNASTTIPNDQKGFADFCYGSMVSCKEGNMFACARNMSRHTNQ